MSIVRVLILTNGDKRCFRQSDGWKVLQWEKGSHISLENKKLKAVKTFFFHNILEYDVRFAE